MTDAKRKRQAPIRATVSDRQSEMAPAKKRGPYIRDQKLKNAFKNLVRQGLPVASVRRQLQDDFPDARLPSDRTIERWAAEYRKSQGVVMWQWTGKDGDNWLLQVQTAVLQYTVGEALISDKQAEVLKLIHSLVPQMPPLTAWLFCLEFLDSPKGQEQHILNSLGFAQLVSAKGGSAPEAVQAHVASHVRYWPDRPLLAWVPNPDTAMLYLKMVGPYLTKRHIEVGQFFWALVKDKGLILPYLGGERIWAWRKEAALQGRDLFDRGKRDTS